MGRVWALLLGILLISHGGVGLFIEGEHILGIFNTDVLIDVVYLVCGIALLLAGALPTSGAVLRPVLAASGVVLLGIGLLALGDDTVGGLFPTGFTLIDLLLFFTAGGGSLLFAVTPRTAAPLETEGVRILG
jgi:hypothetical protein